MGWYTGEAEEYERAAARRAAVQLYDPWHDTLYGGNLSKREEKYEAMRRLTWPIPPPSCTYFRGFCAACDREHKYTVLDPGETW